MDLHNAGDALRRVWVTRRNRLLASPRFRQIAASLWITRGIARRRARAAFDLVAGFTYSQVLAACIETGLLDTLAGEPLDADAIAARLDLPVDGALRLLRAAAALGLAQPLGARWTLGSAGAALHGDPGIAAMVAHHRLLYADLADPVALLRRGGGGGALAGYWHYAGRSGEGDATAVAPYSALMAASQPMVAEQAIDACDFGRHRRLLDIGGGEGAFLSTVATRSPALRLGLFDLPAVGDRAAARFAATGLDARIEVHRGDFLRDPLPAGYGAISLVRILHDHDDAPVRALLRRVHAALPPGGTLYVVEPMAATRGAAPMGDAYFGLYLLAMGSGRPRTASEIGAMLREAGFRRVTRRPTTLPVIASVITGRK